VNIYNHPIHTAFGLHYPWKTHKFKFPCWKRPVSSEYWLDNFATQLAVVAAVITQTIRTVCYTNVGNICNMRSYLIGSSKRKR
jgi:hypothetical protein